MGKGQWQFEGGAFHESLPEGRSAGTLEVSPVSVKFVSEAGTVEMHLHRAGLGDKFHADRAHLQRTR